MTPASSHPNLAAYRALVSPTDSNLSQQSSAIASGDTYEGKASRCECTAGSDLKLNLTPGNQGPGRAQSHHVRGRWAVFAGALLSVPTLLCSGPFGQVTLVAGFTGARDFAFQYAGLWVSAVGREGTVSVVDDAVSAANANAALADDSTSIATLLAIGSGACSAVLAVGAGYRSGGLVARACGVPPRARNTLLLCRLAGVGFSAGFPMLAPLGPALTAANALDAAATFARRWGSVWPRITGQFTRDLLNAVTRGTLPTSVTPIDPRTGKPLEGKNLKTYNCWRLLFATSGYLAGSLLHQLWLKERVGVPLSSSLLEAFDGAFGVYAHVFAAGIMGCTLKCDSGEPRRILENLGALPQWWTQETRQEFEALSDDERMVAIKLIRERKRAQTWAHWMDNGSMRGAGYAPVEFLAGAAGGFEISLDFFGPAGAAAAANAETELRGTMVVEGQKAETAAREWKANEKRKAENELRLADPKAVDGRDEKSEPSVLTAVRQGPAAELIFHPAEDSMFQRNEQAQSAEIPQLRIHVPPSPHGMDIGSPHVTPPSDDKFTPRSRKSRASGTPSSGVLRQPLLPLAEHGAPVAAHIGGAHGVGTPSTASRSFNAGSPTSSVSEAQTPLSPMLPVEWNPFASASGALPPISPLHAQRGLEDTEESGHIDWWMRSPLTRDSASPGMRSPDVQRRAPDWG